jgi:hypothetical protein
MRMFVLQRETGKKFHSEDLNNLYSTKYYYGDQMNEDGRACSTYGRDVKCIVRKSERRRSLGRIGHTWRDNIRMNLKDLRCGSVNWNNVTQDKVQWQILVNIVKVKGKKVKVNCPCV